MYIDPNVYTGRPTDDRIPQELAVYDRLEELNIPYLRVDHDHADTIFPVSITPLLNPVVPEV